MATCQAYCVALLMIACFDITQCLILILFSFLEYDFMVIGFCMFSDYSFTSIQSAIPASPFLKLIVPYLIYTTVIHSPFSQDFG